MRYVIP